jgi:chromosome segregation ATPase
MTTTDYFFAIIAKSFGIAKRNKRLADASSEMNLLREAEYQLGSRLWENIEPVDELSVEYWNLRKQIKEKDELFLKQNELNEKLNQSHVDRTEILNSISDEQTKLEQQQAKLLLAIEEISYERDDIVKQAHDIRRNHDGLLTKIEVIKQSGAEVKLVDKENDKILIIKNEFQKLKENRQQIATKLVEFDKELDAIEQKIAVYKQERRDKAAIIFQRVGDINRELSDVRSQIGTLDLNIRQLMNGVGLYVSRNYQRNEICKKAAYSQRNMVEVMRQLRISIAYNHKLADFH